MIVSPENILRERMSEALTPGKELDYWYKIILKELKNFGKERAKLSDGEIITNKMGEVRGDLEIISELVFNLIFVDNQFEKPNFEKPDYDSRIKLIKKLTNFISSKPYKIYIQEFCELTYDLKFPNTEPRSMEGYTRLWDMTDTNMRRLDIIYDEKITIKQVNQLRDLKLSLIDELRSIDLDINDLEIQSHYIELYFEHRTFTYYFIKDSDLEEMKQHLELANEDIGVGYVKDEELEL
jgi:hypothetical protein